MRKWKIFLIIVGFLILFAVFTLHCIGFIYILPIPEYQRKTGQINLREICEKKIENRQSQKLCFEIIKDNDFKHGLSLLVQAWDYPLEDFPWYYYDGIYFYSRPFIKGVEKLITEGTNHNPAIRCREFSTFPDGTQVNENYYLCRAFLENPHFCKRIYSDFSEVPKDKMKRLCYEDTALIWKDPLFCEKALNQDFCYLRLVLKYLENI